MGNNTFQSMYMVRVSDSEGTINCYELLFHRRVSGVYYHHVEQKNLNVVLNTFTANIKFQKNKKVYRFSFF